MANPNEDSLHAPNANESSTYIYICLLLARRIIDFKSNLFNRY